MFLEILGKRFINSSLKKEMTRVITSPVCKETITISKGIRSQILDDQRKELDVHGRKLGLFLSGGPHSIGTGSLIRIIYRVTLKSDKKSSFTGILISLKRNCAEPTITLRTVIDGVGVEQLFCVLSPLIDAIEVIRPADVYRTKDLYHLRDKPEDLMKLQRSLLISNTQTF